VSLARRAAHVDHLAQGDDVRAVLGLEVEDELVAGERRAKPVGRLGGYVPTDDLASFERDIETDAAVLCLRH
jgi:hypothetical protein